MPATRSSSRIASVPLFPVKKPGAAGSPTKKKRATATDKDVPVAKRPKSVPTIRSTPTTSKNVQVAVSSSKTPNEVKTLPTFNLKPAHLDPTRVIPANLGFDFQQAKKHLIGVDPRFGKVFETLPCRPFEDLESVDPFRSVMIGYSLASAGGWGLELEIPFEQENVNLVTGADISFFYLFCSLSPLHRLLTTSRSSPRNANPLLLRAIPPKLLFLPTPHLERNEIQIAMHLDNRPTSIMVSSPGDQSQV
jgi:hypothetical protein